MFLMCLVKYLFGSFSGWLARRLRLRYDMAIEEREWIKSRPTPISWQNAREQKAIVATQTKKMFDSLRSVLWRPLGEL